MEVPTDDQPHVENSHKELLLSIVTYMQTLMCQGYFFIDVKVTLLYKKYRYRCRSRFRTGISLSCIHLTHILTKK